MSTLHTVSTEEVTVAIDVDCTYCGFAGTASVRSKGTGEATSVAFFDREHARRAAMEQAAEDVMHQARVTASLLPCQRCRRRSRSAVVGYTLMTALGVIGLCVLAPLCVWLKPGFWGWATAAAALSGAGYVVWSKRKRFLESESLLEGVRLRVQLPAAAVVKAPPPRKPMVTVAPPPPSASPVLEDGSTSEPKLLR